MVIELSIENGIATILFNRPDKYNAMIREMAIAIQDALDACAKDENVRCIVLKGAGKAFCKGVQIGIVETVPARTPAGCGRIGVADGI